jgi:hypothetical protein
MGRPSRQLSLSFGAPVYSSAPTNHDPVVHYCWVANAGNEMLRNPGSATHEYLKTAANLDGSFIFHGEL